MNRADIDTAWAQLRPATRKEASDFWRTCPGETERPDGASSLPDAFSTGGVNPLQQTYSMNSLQVKHKHCLAKQLPVAALRPDVEALPVHDDAHGVSLLYQALHERSCHTGFQVMYSLCFSKMGRPAFLTLPPEAGESHATEAKSALAKGPVKERQNEANRLNLSAHRWRGSIHASLFQCCTCVLWLWRRFRVAVHRRSR